VAGNIQKANALSAGHHPSNLEGNACKCPRLRQIVPTRPSVKCQRCAVGFNFGFGDGRGDHTSTVVDILIQHHVRISFEISSHAGRHPSCLPRAQMVCEDLSISVASRTEHFWVWALGPQTGSISSGRLFHGPLSNATPRHLSAFCRCAKGGRLPCSHGGHTRYWMTAAPVPGHFRESRWAHKMHAGPLTGLGDLHLV